MALLLDTRDVQPEERHDAVRDAYALAARIPMISRSADRLLIRKLTKELARYGHAEFRTNADGYHPAHT